MLNRSDIASVTVKAITEILEEEGEKPSRISGGDSLTGLGVSSLVFARVAIELEDELGVDPFKEGLEGEVSVQTVDDLIDAYENALAKSGAQ
ncbi:acyl carrier protein [Streptomyces sp. NPDC014894]|uniref:acyl carrier protein n=1 Tax=unclassified Streptomyces TaxID=2593676 RepID=UPI0036FCC9DF